jgi:voltage-gated potassium channel
VLESDGQLSERHHQQLQLLEWIFTLLFTQEYCLRVSCSPSPWRYARSFYGLVDLLAILPGLGIWLLAATPQYFLVVRSLRILRIFRILKLADYSEESTLLWQALVASRRKILVFLLAMLTLVVMIGTLMYLVEGPRSGFDSIPVGIYWAVVTITTVGYGDVTPISPLGRIIATAVMMMGFGIIAVPTGIVGASLSDVIHQRQRLLLPCPGCRQRSHQADARFCSRCGSSLQQARQRQIS